MIKQIRPAVLFGQTVKWPLERNLYVTINALDGNPFAVYGKSGEREYGMSEAICRLVSFHLRNGTTIEEIIKQLDGIQEGQAYPCRDHEGREGWITGIADAIAEQLKRYVMHFQEDSDAVADSGGSSAVRDGVHESDPDGADGTAPTDEPPDIDAEGDSTRAYYEQARIKLEEESDGAE